MEVTFEKLLSDAHYPPHPPFLKIQHKPTATMLFILTKMGEAGWEKEGMVRKDVKCGGSLDTSPLFLPHTQELLNNLKDTMYSTRTPSKYLFLSGSKNTVIMNVPWLVTSFTGNRTVVSSPTAYAVPSGNALEHNDISGRVHTPRKRQS